MSALRGVAWGLVDTTDPRDWPWWITQVNNEIGPTGLWLCKSTAYAGHFAAWDTHTCAPDWRLVKKGTIVECCDALLAIIEPPTTRRSREGLPAPVRI